MHWCLVTCLTLSFCLIERIGNAQASTWRFEKEYVVVPGEGGFQSAQWSTDGTLLAAHGRGGVFIHNPLSRSMQMVASGYIRDFLWLPGCKLIYNLEKNRKSEIHMLQVSTGADKRLLTISAYEFYQMQSTIDGTLAFTNRVRPSPWKADMVDTTGNWTPFHDSAITQLIWYQEGPAGDEVWIRKSGETRKVPIAGPLWLPIQPSPQANFLAIQTEVDKEVRTVVMDNRGQRIKVLPFGFMASQWSSDERVVLGAETRDDGETIKSSQLALFDLRSGEYVFVATEPGMIPMDPTWHSGTGRLAFTDYRNGSLVVGVLHETAE